jgi:hypothetical protein
LAARVELATKVLGTFARKSLGFVESIIKKNALLNSVYLREEELFAVSNNALMGFPELQPGPNGETPLKIGREMYARSYEVEFRCDLRFASMQQRIAEADEVVGMSLQDPLLASNLQFRYYALKKAFEARGRPDLVRALGPPPPPGMMAPPAPPQPGAGKPPEGPKVPPPAQQPQQPPQ